jgi:hypothetical protein
VSELSRPNFGPRPRHLSQLAISAARWPPAAALAGLLTVGAVFPEKYGLLPRWASGPLWLLVLVLIGLSAFAHASPLLRRLEGPVTFGLLALVTGLLVYDVLKLVNLVLAEGSQVRGVPLLSTGATLWLSNTIVFGLWYWQLDRGGPERRRSGAEVDPDLRFPPDGDPDRPPWTPEFFDYVFVAFNMSIAFSPSDTSPLTTRAKLLMMTQALLSLITLVIVVARAVNILD